MGGRGSQGPPWVFMTYHYGGGSVGGGNVGMPSAILPVLIARFKQMAGLDLAEQQAPQQGHTTLQRQDRSYELRVSTELPPAQLGYSAPDRFAWGEPAPDYARLTLRLEPKPAS